MVYRLFSIYARVSLKLTAIPNAPVVPFDQPANCCNFFTESANNDL